LWVNLDVTSLLVPSYVFILYDRVILFILLLL
jgi:hypothetical protein